MKMLNVTLKKNLSRLMPSPIMRMIDPLSYWIEEFAFSLAEELPAYSRVLDAGAGECPFKKFFSRHGYVAVDREWGDASWDYSNLDLIADLANLPFRERVFDAVISTQVLEHISEPEIVLRELYRVIKRGGTIYLSAPQGWGVHQSPHDYFRYTRYGLEHLLKKVGFKVRNVDQSGGYFTYLANRLTVLPKVLFWQIKSRWLRILMSPLELVSYVLFVLIFPVILNAVDFLDQRRDYTLNYFVKASKSNA